MNNLIRFCDKGMNRIKQLKIYVVQNQWRFKVVNLKNQKMKRFTPFSFASHLLVYAVFPYSINYSFTHILDIEFLIMLLRHEQECTLVVNPCLIL